MALYLLQLASPLRIDNDSVVYLGVALRLAADIDGAGGRLPLGYPYAVAALYRAGVATPQALLAMNFSFVALGLASVSWIARSYSTNLRLAAIAMTLLSFPILRISIMAHPDAMAFGFSMIALGLLSTTTNQRSLRNGMLLVAATGVTALAATTRVAAIVLMAPTLWCLARIAAPRNRNEMQVMVAGSLSLLAAATVAVLATEDGTFTRYVDEVAWQLQKNSLAYFMLLRLGGVFHAFGELFLNAPLRQPPHLRPILMTVGFVPAVFLLATRHLRRWHPAISVYIVTLIVVLIIWPFYTTRLWVTLIPLLMLHTLGVFATFPRGGLRYRAAQLWMVWLAFVGMVALTHVSRVSLSGDKFMSRWGSNGGLSDPGRPNAEHDARAKVIARKFDAGNVAWRALLSEDSLSTRPADDTARVSVP